MARNTSNGSKDSSAGFGFEAKLWLAAEAKCTIDLLQERRSALISAVATGQIDVRQA